MEMTEIRKESLGVVEQVNEVLTGLSEKAKSVLGYDALAKAIGKTAQLELTELQAVLKGLDIEILNPADVLAYQKQRMMEQTGANLGEWLKEISAKDKLYNFDRFSGPSWVRTKINEYKQPVPEFVLAKAVQIKEACPTVEVWIESLENNPDPFLSVGFGDPKYSWSEPTERYYVEVWAEPKFEGRFA